MHFLNLFSNTKPIYFSFAVKRTAKALSYTINSYHLPHQQNHGTDRVWGPQKASFHSARAACTRPYLWPLGWPGNLPQWVSCHVCCLVVWAGCWHVDQPCSAQDGDKKDFTKGCENIVGMDSTISNVRAAPVPLPERYRFAQLVRSSTERKGCSRIKQSQHNVLETLKLSV